MNLRFRHGTEGRRSDLHTAARTEQATESRPRQERLSKGEFPKSPESWFTLRDLGVPHEEAVSRAEQVWNERHPDHPVRRD